jgi:hypothetical protein
MAGRAHRKTAVLGWALSGCVEALAWPVNHWAHIIVSHRRE